MRTGFQANIARCRERELIRQKNAFLRFELTGRLVSRRSCADRRVGIVIAVRSFFLLAGRGGRRGYESDERKGEDRWEKTHQPAGAPWIGAVHGRLEGCQEAFTPAVPVTREVVAGSVPVVILLVVQ